MNSSITNNPPVNQVTSQLSYLRGPSGSQVVKIHPIITYIYIIPLLVSIPAPVVGNKTFEHVLNKQHNYQLRAASQLVNGLW